MQYGIRMLNKWQELKLKHPTQINAVNIVDDKGNQGTFMHIRAALFNYLIRSKPMTLTTPDLTRYIENQKKTTVDNLTTQLTTLSTTIGNLEQQLADRCAEHEVTKKVLREQLEERLQKLEPEFKEELPRAKDSFKATVSKDELVESFTDEIV